MHAESVNADSLTTLAPLLEFGSNMRCRVGLLGVVSTHLVVLGTPAFAHLEVLFALASRARANNTTMHARARANV